MKTSGRQSKNVIDRRNQRIAPDIVGMAKRNAEDVQWMKDSKSVPEKVKKDMGNALASIRRNAAVKQTRSNPTKTPVKQVVKSRKKGRVK